MKGGGGGGGGGVAREVLSSHRHFMVPTGRCGLTTSTKLNHASMSSSFFFFIYIFFIASQYHTFYEWVETGNWNTL